MSRDTLADHPIAASKQIQQLLVSNIPIPRFIPLVNAILRFIWNDAADARTSYNGRALINRDGRVMRCQEVRISSQLCCGRLTAVCCVVAANRLQIT